MSGPKFSNFLTANRIRQIFLDYFRNNGHTFIRPSSVKPFGDSSLEFVNAGMNQFKNVFLGLESIPYSRGVNSQKCIRVGGKHNDLDSVGLDAYHHTFFEMLGNWSFNDYFKEEACHLAWNLVTDKPFSLDPNRLYVTYFGGDEKFNLEPDLETREIWLKLGVDKDRVLPFGLTDNFWEMGLHGPCGPCTEIHYDHVGSQPRPHLVNSGLPDLTELWNIVFIQYNRLEDKQLEKLDKHYVDTGMGLERLVALLQKKNSNYDTDLFFPYFSAISKLTGLREYRGMFGESDKDGIDTAYRILADHSRMITIAVADNIFPDESHGLRRVIRKALITSERLVHGDSVKLVTELCRIAAESFSSVFPETMNIHGQIEYVLLDEREIWEETKEKVRSDWQELLKKHPQLGVLSDVQSTGLVSSFKELEASNLESGTTLPRHLALVMYDRYGLTPQVIEQLVTIAGYSVNLDVLNKDISDLKEKNKALLYSSNKSNLLLSTSEIISRKFNRTNDSSKLNYFKNMDNNYSFDNIKCNVEAVIMDGILLNERDLLKDGTEVSLLLDQTNMWSTPSINCCGDIGQLILTNKGESVATVSINNVINVGGYIHHVGTLNSPSSISVLELKESNAELFLDKERRLKLMTNTTAAHLFSIVAKEKFQASLQDFSIGDKTFSLTFSIYGHPFNDQDVKVLEEGTIDLIKKSIDIELNKKSTNDLVGLSGLVIPPAINLSVIKELYIVNFKSNPEVRAVTFGPNLLNTLDVGSVCIVNFERKNRGREVVFEAVAGNAADIAKKNAQLLMSTVSSEGINEESIKILKKFLKNNSIPWSIQEEVEKKIDTYNSSIKAKQLMNKIESLRNVISRAEANGDKFIVTFCGHDAKLEKLARTPVKIPMLLFGVNKKHLNARCFVPERNNFSAEEWMGHIAAEFGASAVPSKKYAPQVFYMSPLRVQSHQLHDVLSRFESVAKSTAEALANRSKSNGSFLSAEEAKEKLS